MVLISCTATAQFIYTFDFAYAKSRFSYDMSYDVTHNMILLNFQVRETASVTLSGLLHCGYMDMDKDMLVSLSVCLSLSVCQLS